MPHTSTTLTPDLTDLIRLQRTDVAGLTQKGAAAAANVSVVWLRQIETGAAPTARAGTIAKICYALDISPDQLRSIGQDHIAVLVQRRRDLLGADEDISIEADLEAYLRAAPGLTRQSVTVLVSVALGLLKAQTDEPEENGTDPNHGQTSASISA